MRVRNLLACGVVLALAACTAPPAPTGPSTSAPGTSSRPTSTQPPSVDPRTGAIIAREGIDYEVLFDVAPVAGDGKWESVEAVLADGSALVSRALPGIPLNRMELSLRSKDSEVGLPATLDGPSRQMIAGIASPGQTIAWVETSMTSLLESDWELFAMDGQRSVRHVASSTTYQTQPLPRSPDYTPVAVDTRMRMSQL